MLRTRPLSSGAEEKVTVRTWKKIVLASLWTLAAACGDGEGPEPGASSTCEKICARSQAARCGGDTPDCEATCEDQIGDSPSACARQLDAVTACLSSAKFSCDEDDESEAKACDGKLEAWVACVGQHGGGSPAPAPDDGPDADMCAAASDDTRCTSCQKQQCCDAVSACDGACAGFVDCVDACADDDDACVAACVKASPSGAAAFSDMYSCALARCNDACELSEPSAPSQGAGKPPAACLQIEVSAHDNCAGTGMAYAYDCAERPYADCVDSPTGFTGVYCCSK